MKRYATLLAAALIFLSINIKAQTNIGKYNTEPYVSQPGDHAAIQGNHRDIVTALVCNIRIHASRIDRNSKRIRTNRDVTTNNYAVCRGINHRNRIPAGI